MKKIAQRNLFGFIQTVNTAEESLYFALGKTAEKMVF